MNEVMERFENSVRIVELEDHASQQTLAMASSLISLIDLHDRYTGRHSMRVAAYCRRIAMRMELSHEDREQVVAAGVLHDIGTIGVPDSVLLKVGTLTEEEFGWTRKHPEFGWKAVRNVDGFHAAAEQILHHHERWDGNGYPGNLSGNEIPLGASIISVADSFDALTTDRPYRKRRSHAEALCEISRYSGTQFNPDVVRAFCDSMSRGIAQQESCVRS